MEANELIALLVAMLVGTITPSVLSRIRVALVRGSHAIRHLAKVVGALEGEEDDHV